MIIGTVLANEEIIDGLSERGNHPVIRQPLRQWVLGITKYADKLEGGFDQLDWPDGTVAAQKQWIGRSVGANIRFKVDGFDDSTLVEVFTTRPDTLMGVTYLVLAPEHHLVKKLTTADQRTCVSAYISSIVGKSDLERTSIGINRGKTGAFLGSFAIHPITQEKVPIWIADYVLSGYGTGMVMAVPAHDERDFLFAQTFDLPVKTVVRPISNDDELILPYTGLGISCNSGDFNNLSSEACKEAVINNLSQSGYGNEQVSYKLRDWVFSRQRYWGEPIPIYFPVEILTPDKQGSPIEGAAHKILYDQPIAVDDCDLPLKLPALSNFQPGDDPQGCLARAVEWRYFQKNGKWFARETNTMPQVSNCRIC